MPGRRNIENLFLLRVWAWTAALGPPISSKPNTASGLQVCAVPNTLDRDPYSVRDITYCAH